MNEQVPSKEPFFVGYLRAYAVYFRKPHEQRELGIRDSYLLSCAEEMERAADELERLRRENAELLKRNVILSSTHEPAPAPRFQVGQEVFAGCAVRKVLAISHCYKLSNTICEGSGWTMFDEHSVEPCSGTTKPVGYCKCAFNDADGTVIPGEPCQIHPEAHRG